MRAFGRLLDHFSRHVATEIDFNHNVVGVEVVVAAHHGLAPLRRASNHGPVSERGKSQSLSSAEVTMPTSSPLPDGSPCKVSRCNGWV
jgi:hypothetical protein